MTETEPSSPTSTTSSSSSGDFSPRKSEDKISYKKSNKPMMEKKRRARINSCLSQLKSLVLQAMKKDNSQYSKLEKADILELTVKHLKNVQRYQANTLGQHPESVSKYRAGFNECANEVVKYLGESQGVNEEARTRIISHLASILSPFNTLQQTHTAILPASLQHTQQHQHQSHLQMYHLQQQQHQNVFLTSSSQPLSIDTNNTQSIISYPAFISSTGGNLDIGQIMSNSPTAFQPPVITGVNVPPGLQIPCIATAAMTTTQQLQLGNSTLPSGHVTLALAPQNFSSMYTAHPGISPQGSLDIENSLPKSVSQVSDCKSQGGMNNNNHVAIVKSTRLQRPANTISAGIPVQPSTPCLTRMSLDRLPTMHLMASSPHSLNPNLKKLNILTACTVSNNATSAITTGTFYKTNNNFSTNVVRTTSTWRPW